MSDTTNDVVSNHVVREDAAAWSWDHADFAVASGDRAISMLATLASGLEVVTARLALLEANRKVTSSMGLANSQAIQERIASEYCSLTTDRASAAACTAALATAKAIGSLIAASVTLGLAERDEQDDKDAQSVRATAKAGHNGLALASTTTLETGASWLARSLAARASERAGK